MKKKGFTLIELLAVIVILAIIALIVTPLVLKYIEKSRQESKVDSAYSFVRNLETEIANFSIKNNGKKYNGQPSDKGYYELDSFNGSEIDTTVKGDKPNSIKVCLSSLGQVEKAMFEYGKYYVSYDGKKGSISDKDTYDNFSCSGNEIMTEASGLYDSNNILLYTWDELVNNYGINIELDYLDENGKPIVEPSKFPGIMLATDENLSKGTKLVIDNSVTKIGNWALGVIPDGGYKSNLVEIVIPNTVSKIGSSSFYNCANLKKIEIPNSITSIGSEAFYDCASLVEIDIPEGVTTLSEALFSNCAALKKVTLPSTITNIDDYAFTDCASLEEINIPNGVVTIGKLAFQACASLEEVVIPNSVTSVGGRTFESCDNLKTVVLSNKMAEIEFDMFKYCTNLTSLTIPKSITHIGNNTFYGAKNDPEINYEGNEIEWNAITFGDNNSWFPSGAKINYNYKIN